jgi:hypothetical protein
MIHPVWRNLFSFIPVVRARWILKFEFKTREALRIIQRQLPTRTIGLVIWEMLRLPLHINLPLAHSIPVLYVWWDEDLLRLGRFTVGGINI